MDTKVALTVSGGAPLDATGNGDVDSALLPYRSWALQKNVISLLGGETEWRTVERRVEDIETVAISRGNAALIEQLEPDPEIAGRVRAMAVLWAAALLLEVFNHYSGVGAGDSASNFLLISGMIAFAVIVTLTVFPRLTFPQFIVVGQIVLLYAYVLIAIKVAGTGGMSSPYAVLWVMVTLYVAYFVARVRAIPNLALLSAIMLAPAFYDDTTDVEAGIFLAVLLAACLVLAYSVLSGRELSRRADRTVRYLALADPLTGVANLRSFEAAVKHAAGEGERPFALVEVGIYGVKGAVAAFGHEIGDDMLQRLSRLLRLACGERDQVARIRDDEFAVLLDGRDEAAARRWLDELNGLIARHNEWARNRLPRIEIETGMAVFPRDGEDFTRLARAADKRVRKARAAVVRPPYEVDAATPHDAGELLKPVGEIFDPRTRQMRKLSQQSAIRWLLTAAALGVYLAIPGLEHRSYLVIGSTAAISMAMGMWGAFAQVRRRPFPYLYASDVLTLLLIVPNMWGTGGWQSPLQPTVFFPVAFYAQYLSGRHATFRAGAVILLYSFAFWTSDAVGAASGAPSEAAHSLFLGIVITMVVITAILQRSRRATDEAIDTIRRSATFDPLTGARNVHAFRTELLSRVRHADRESDGAVPALLIADIDDFRAINDRAGHVEGDAILRSVAERLRKIVGDDGAVFRIDSDEFAVIAPVEGAVDVQVLRERISRIFDVRETFERQFGERVALSIGVAVWGPGDSAAAMVETAEAQLGASRAAMRSSTARHGGAMLL